MYNAFVPYILALQTIEIKDLLINCITMASESLQRLFDYILCILYNIIIILSIM